jgi:peptide/nickel transport system substrate-binding protein
VAILGVLAAGCHPGAYQIGENNINPVATSSLAQGGTLNWPIGALPSNYNGNAAAGAGGDEAAILAALMPRMFTFSAAGEPQLDGNYLASAQVTGTSPMVVTYEINPKATWSNGTPITAADFQAQWQALNGSNPAFTAASNNGYDLVSSVAQGKSPEEVVVTFRQPFSDWRGLFSPLYPAALNASPATFNGGWITGTAVSAGPFRFQGFDATAGTVTVVRDPHWWGTPAVLDAIVFHAVGDDPTAQLAALRSGQIDFAQLQAQRSQLQTAQGIKGTTVRSSAGTDFRQVTMNGTGNLSDVRVRRAIALAIDRSAIAQAVLSPLGVPDQELNNHIFLMNQQGYQNNAGTLTSPDRTEAGSLLTQAGWKLVKGARTSASGQTLQLRLVIPSGIPQAATEASMIKKDIEAVGVTVLVQTVPTTSFFTDYVLTGNFDLTLFSWEGSVFPITISRSIYASPSPVPNGVPIAGHNYARIGTAAIDNLYVQASMTLQPAQVITLGNDIDAQVWQEVHSLTLYEEPDIVVERSKLANFGAFGLASVDYQTIGFTK